MYDHDPSSLQSLLLKGTCGVHKMSYKYDEYI